MTAGVARRAIAGSTLAVLGGSLAALGASLALRVVMARALSPAELGLVLLAIAVVTPVGSIASLGLNAAVAGVVAGSRAHGDQAGARAAARRALRLAAGAGLLAAAALAAAATPLAGAMGKPALAAVLRVAAPVALGLAAGTAMLGVARGHGDTAGRALLRDAGGGVLRVAGAGAALLAGAPTPVGVTAGWAGGSLAAETLFVAWGAARGWLRAPSAPAGPEPALRVRPFAANEVLVQAAQWLDLLVLGAFAPPATVALYGVARGLTRVIDAIRQSAAHGFLPAAAGAVSRGEAHLLAPLWAGTRLFAFALAFGPLALCLLAPAPLLSALFGGAYAAGAPLLRLLAAAALAASLFDYLDLALVAEGRPERVFRASLAGVATFAAALLLLVPRLGGAGAALALLVSSTVKGLLLGADLLGVPGALTALAPLGRAVLLALLGATAAAALLRVARPGPAAALGAALAVGGTGTALLLRAFRSRGAP